MADSDLGYSFRIHGNEFNSFRGRTRSNPLREFRLPRQEKFLYICDSVSWTFKKSLRPTTETPFAWAVVALRLLKLRWPPWLSADAQTSAAGSERQRSGLSGSKDSVACPLRIPSSQSARGIYSRFHKRS